VRKRIMFLITAIAAVVTFAFLPSADGAVPHYAQHSAVSHSAPVHPNTASNVCSPYSSNYTTRLYFGGNNSPLTGNCCFISGAFYIHDPNVTTWMNFQNDGNLVMYYLAPGNVVHVGGQTRTYNEGAYYLCAQTDGNLVIYDTNYHPLWWSGTSCTGSPCFVAEIYSGTGYLSGHNVFVGSVNYWWMGLTNEVIEKVIGRSP
jgi:hypothetical protein